MSDQTLELGIDVGGSSIKGGLVDTATGRRVSTRIDVPTPHGFDFERVVDAIVEVAKKLDVSSPFGVGIPAAVSRGQVLSRPTALEYPDWVGRDLAAALTERHGEPVSVANDADAAGIAEMHFGAGLERDGVVLVFTLGTGIGSALFVDGMLVPNTELGKLYLRDAREVAELSVASRVRIEDGLSWDEWGARLASYLKHIDRLFSPELVILGGGISRDADRFLPMIDLRCEVRPARLRNDAGIVGAACLVSSLSRA